MRCEDAALQQIQLENLKKELDAHTSSFVDVEDDP